MMGGDLDKEKTQIACMSNPQIAKTVDGLVAWGEGNLKLRGQLSHELRLVQVRVLGVQWISSGRPWVEPSAGVASGQLDIRPCR